MLWSTSLCTRRLTILFASLAAGVAVTAARPAVAETIQSHYTSAAEKACKPFAKNKPNEEMPWSETRCPGRAGYLVRLFDGDLRMTVSVGRTMAEAEKEPAASQGFGPFNQAKETVEWRSVAGKPFAIIQRWTIADNENPDKSGRPKSVPLLVVTRLPPGPVCHVAYIDAQANSDANVLARQAADQTARAFRCGTDEAQVVGKRGRAAELAKPANP
jgi:hypothetical protein